LAKWQGRSAGLGGDHRSPHARGGAHRTPGARTGTARLRQQQVRLGSGVSGGGVYPARPMARRRIWYAEPSGEGEMFVVFCSVSPSAGQAINH